MRERGSDLRVGISGWTYRAWRGNFYPGGLPHKDELAFASRRFNSIEINGTHYSLQRPSSFALWDRATPSDFVFALKGSRYITHMLKLRGVEVALANFFASGPLRLGRKLGPILWQLPERFRFDADRLERFFELLPIPTMLGVSCAGSPSSRRYSPAMTCQLALRPGVLRLRGSLT